MLGQADYFTGGWTCAFCGAFITHNTFHACTNMQPEYQGTDVPIILSKDDEIIRKLGRIIELLEKISGEVL